MPLDGTEMFENPILGKLWQVECMLATEDQWCKGRLHDRKGRHCLVGAMTEVNGRQDLTRPIIRAIKEISGRHYWRIESFNDDPSTNHQDVLRVLHRARLILISEIAEADEPRAWYLKLLDKIEGILSGPKDNAGLYAFASNPAPVRVAVSDRAAEEHHRPVRETIDAI
jgi:hypothetical protein